MLPHSELQLLAAASGITLSSSRRPRSSRLDCEKVNWRIILNDRIGQ